MQKQPRFGIGINDQRIPSGLMGKTPFGERFEQSIRSPVIDFIFDVFNKFTTSDKVLRILAQPKWNPFKLTKYILDFAGLPIDKMILTNNSAMKLALFGKQGTPQHRSALLGLILNQFQQYIVTWHNRQQQKIPVPRIHRRIKPPAKTYEGWKACQNEIYPEWQFYPPKGEFVKILPTDTMTPKERIMRIIQGKGPDRVGLGPNWNFAPCYLGGSNIWEFCYDGIATGLASVNTWRRIGGCDFLPIGTGLGSYAVPLPDIHSRYYYKWGLPDDSSFPQFIEESLIKSYDDLFNYGLSHQAQEITKRLMQDTWVMFRELIYYGKIIDRYFHPIKDQFYTYAAGMISSMDLLPMARGLVPFSRDVRKNPELIAEAFEFMGKPLADMMIQLAKFMKTKSVLVGCSRGSNSWMSVKQFETTHWPMLQYCLKRLIAADLIPTCHFDNDWTENMSFLANHLPKRSCLFHLDQVDLVKVHEQIGDHFCLMGGLSPGDICLSTPEQLEAKLKRYIEAIGTDGLILASGCEFPIDIPIANFQTYKRAIMKYGIFHK